MHVLIYVAGWCWSSSMARHCATPTRSSQTSTSTGPTWPVACSRPSSPRFWRRVWSTPIPTPATSSCSQTARSRRSTSDRSYGYAAQRLALARLLMAVNRQDPELLRDALLELTTPGPGPGLDALDHALAGFLTQRLGPGARPGAEICH